jgi:hypothetical protein
LVKDKIEKYNMKTNKSQEYISPEVKVVEVLVEKGYLITGVVINERMKQEKHVLDEPETW